MFRKQLLQRLNTARTSGVDHHGAGTDTIQLCSTFNLTASQADGRHQDTLAVLAPYTRFFYLQV